MYSQIPGIKTLTFFFAGSGDIFLLTADGFQKIVCGTLSIFSLLG